MQPFVALPALLANLRPRAPDNREPVDVAETDSGAQSASSEDLFEDIVAVSKCKQSMTTYTSLRGTGTARFRAISLELSGVWDELDRQLPMVHLQ